MGPWWVNALAGVVCMALAVNFFAQAYGLRLGGTPVTFHDLLPNGGTVYIPPTTLNNSLPDDLRNMRAAPMPLDVK